MGYYLYFRTKSRGREVFGAGSLGGCGSQIRILLSYFKLGFWRWGAIFDSVFDLSFWLGTFY